MENQKMDRRIQRTRQLLQDALIALILEKGYDKITVQDIIDRANVGRSTFYAHYLDKDDLMESSLEVLREELGQHFHSSRENDAQNVVMPSLALFQHTQHQHHLYKAMIGGRGIDIVIKAIQELLVDHARTYFEAVESSNKKINVPVDVLSIHVASALQTLLTWWLDNELPYPPEKMNEIYSKLLMGGIQGVIEER